MVMKVEGFLPRFGETLKKDMTVYKSLVVDANEPDTYATSIYREYRYILGVEAQTSIKASVFNNKINHGIHAFVNVTDAVNDALKQRQKKHIEKICTLKGWTDHQYNWMFRNKRAELIALWDSLPIINIQAFTCVIPAGAKVYRGLWDAKLPYERILNVVSDRMTVVGVWQNPMDVKEEEEPEVEDVTIQQNVDVEITDQTGEIVQRIMGQVKSGDAFMTVKDNS